MKQTRPVYHALLLLLFCQVSQAYIYYFFHFKFLSCKLRWFLYFFTELLLLQFTFLNNFFKWDIILRFYLIYFSTGRHGLREPKKVEQLETKITESLREYTEYNAHAQKHPNYFAKTLSMVTELKSLSMLGVQRINSFKREPVPVPTTQPIESYYLPNISQY